MGLSEEFETVYDAVSFWESSSRYDPYFSFTQSSYQAAKKLYSEVIRKARTTVEQDIKEE